MAIRGKNNLLTIKKFLLENTEAIEKEATKHHLQYIGSHGFRYEYIEKYFDAHIALVKQMARFIESPNLEKEIQKLKKHGEALAKRSVKDGLTIQEATNGIIFLKQAIWKKLSEAQLLTELTIKEFYHINYIIGTYVDTISSQIAFVYHDTYTQHIEKELKQRKSAENKLNNARKYAEHIVATVREPLIVLNQDLRVISANTSFYKTFRVAKKQTEGKLIYNLGNKQWDIPDLRKLLGEILPKDSAFKDYVVEHTFESIGQRIMLLNARRVDEMHLILLAIEDITEQRKGEQKLRETEKRYKTLFDKSADVITLSDKNGNYFYVTPSIKNVLGYTPEEFKKLNGFAVTHPEDIPFMTKKFKELLKKRGKSSTITFRGHHKNGSWVWIEATATNLLSDPNIKAIVSNFRNITERKKAEEALKESEERFRVMANSIQNLAWMANTDGNIFWYNQRWYDYTGKTFKETKGAGWIKVHHPDHVERVKAFMKDVWKKESAWELTFPLRRADGKYHWFLTRAFPVRDMEGNVVRWIGTNTDIDEQKRALEQKDEFMGIVSHELKTPVTSLKAFEQVLQKRFAQLGDVRAVEHLSKMDAQINKLTILIQDLLDVTKIEGGRLQFHEDYFYFDELVNEIVEEVQRTTESHTIEKTGITKKTIYADRDRIGQVIMNFLTNAIKYSPTADKIHVQTSVENNEIVFCVQDFGVGISKEKQAHVFERFYRVSGDNQETYPGLGLGLYISFQIIQRQGGKIWVESKLGKGSKFYFSIPIRADKKKK